MVVPELLSSQRHGMIKTKLWLDELQALWLQNLQTHEVFLGLSVREVLDMRLQLTHFVVASSLGNGPLILVFAVQQI